MPGASEAFAEWVEAWLANAGPGDMLPTRERLAKAWGISESTVRRKLAPFIAAARLEGVQGRGVGLPRAQAGESGTEEEVRRQSAEQVVERIVESISRGELKRGDQLPAIKTLSLQFHVAPRTITRALHRIQTLGYAQRVGKRYVVGDFHSLRNWSAPREVFLFCEPEYLTRIFEGSFLNRAFREMEDELLACNAQVRYEPVHTTSELAGRWERSRRFPAGVVLTGVDQTNFDGLLPFIRRLTSTRRGARPAVLLVGGGVMKLPRGTDMLYAGTILTAIARSLAQFAVTGGHSRVSVFIDNPTAEMMPHFDNNIRVAVELGNLNARAETRFYIVKTRECGDKAAFIAALKSWRPEIPDYVAKMASKYRPRTYEDIGKSITLVDGTEAAFSAAAHPGLWICATDRLAAQALEWCARHGRAVPGDAAIIGRENDPAYYHLGISSCAIDWRSVGYLMAHSLLKDIPIAKTTRGFIRPRARIYPRLTTR